MSHYHKILGVNISASKQEIKDAFRKLSKKYHPDLNPNSDAKVQFIKVHEAYKFLTSKQTTSSNRFTSTFQQQQYAAKKAYYERKKAAAENYARKKAKEAYRNERRYVQLFLSTFRKISYPIIFVNVILTFDFLVLPLNQKTEEIQYLTQNSENHTILDVHLVSETISINSKDYVEIENIKYATIQKTLLLSLVKGLEIEKNDNKFILHEPTDIYILLRGVAPLITAVLFLVYFYIEFEDFILSSYIIVFLMSLFEFLVVFTKP